jgi:hypothetical protein
VGIIPGGDWITDMVNLLLERMDRLNDVLERIAEALENDEG